MPAITKQLKALEMARLIDRSRQSQFHPCRLQSGPLQDNDEWTEQCRRFFETSFGRLKDDLKKYRY
jgi:hypothetical protein